MGRRHRHSKRTLSRRRERKFLIATLIVCICLGMVLTYATGRLPTWKEKAIASFLMQFIPKDVEREEFLGKAKGAFEDLKGSEQP